jgi:hypothetical protein
MWCGMQMMGRGLEKSGVCGEEYLALMPVLFSYSTHFLYYYYSGLIDSGKNTSVAKWRMGEKNLKREDQFVDKGEDGIILLKSCEGRAIAQALSRRLPTAAARVQTRVWSCGIL